MLRCDPGESSTGVTLTNTLTRILILTLAMALEAPNPSADAVSYLGMLPGAMLPRVAEQAGPRAL